MAEDAIFISTPRGEVRVGTELVIDPDFGPVHLIRTSAAGGAPSSVVDVSDRIARLLGHVVVDSMPAGGAGLTNTELRAAPVDITVGNFPLTFGASQDGAWAVAVNNFPAIQAVSQSGAWSVGQSGAWSVAQSGAWAVAVNNFPAGFNVNNFPATQPVSVARVDLVAAAPVSAAVGVASAVAVAANAVRKGLALVNASGNNISFGLDGNAAQLNKGITLTPNGVWEMDEFTFTTGAIEAIAAGAGSTLAIQEFT